MPAPWGTRNKEWFKPTFCGGMGKAKSGKKKTNHSPFCWILKSILVVVNFFISNPNHPPKKKRKKHDSARPHRLFFILGWGSWSQVHRSSPAVLDQKRGEDNRLGPMAMEKNLVACWEILESFKRRVQSHVARGEMKNLHATVARSFCSSQNVQNTRVLKHFWRFGRRKDVRQMR